MNKLEKYLQRKNRLFNSNQRKKEKRGTIGGDMINLFKDNNKYIKATKLRENNLMESDKDRW